MLIKIQFKSFVNFNVEFIDDVIEWKRKRETAKIKTQSLSHIMMDGKNFRELNVALIDSKFLIFKAIYHDYTFKDYEIRRYVDVAVKIN